MVTVCEESTWSQDPSSLIRAVVGVIKQENRLLVGQRPLGKPYSGYWEFPGGKIEANETGFQALKRELKEELGIEVIEAKRLLDHIHPYPDKTVFLEIWLVEVFKGKPRGLENQLLRWVTFPEMLELKLLEGNWHIIDMIKSALALETPVE